MVLLRRHRALKSVMVDSVPHFLKSIRTWNSLPLLVCAAAFLLIIYSFTPVYRVQSQPQPLNYFFRKDVQTSFHESKLLRKMETPLSPNNPIYTDYRECAYAATSSIHVVDKKVSYIIGDEVMVDIILKDHLGRRKARGGDMVRIWVKDLANRARSAGTVTDNKDGSYRGVVKLLWAGHVTIVARIGASKELVELVIQNVKTDRSPRQINAKFENGRTSEVTKCTAAKRIANNYEKSCDLTFMNSNLSWYCEMPETISCNNWVSNIVSYPNRSYSHQEMMILISVVPAMNLPTTIPLTVNSGLSNPTEALHLTALQEPLLPCTGLPSKLTWSLKTPVGYLYRDRWYSTQCRNTFDGSVTAFNKCLNGRKIWFLGDSTTRQLFEYFMGVCKLHLKTEKWAEKKWHKPSLATNKNETITIFWAPHAHPFLSGLSVKSRLNNKGTHVYIDKVPRMSNDIVIAHFYLHLIGYDTDVLRSRVRRTVESIKALKARAPEVKVVVKGSHTYDKLQRIADQFYDFWGVIYDKILKEEFAVIADDVIFLDVWDMTLAAESWDMHANRTVLEAIIHQMMAFVCSE